LLHTRFDCFSFEKKRKRQRGAKKRKEKAAPIRKKNKERKGSKEKKFRSACILLWSCGELYCCLLELGPGRV
jgi:hypothetical protein